jgi:Ser-tRNA(Ala) deacylase AlaX
MSRPIVSSPRGKAAGGGPFVARTGEIGRAEVTGIEKKGKINRRVRIALA